MELSSLAERVLVKVDVDFSDQRWISKRENSTPRRSGDRSCTISGTATEPARSAASIGSPRPRRRSRRTGAQSQPSPGLPCRLSAPRLPRSRLAKSKTWTRTIGGRLPAGQPPDRDRFRGGQLRPCSTRRPGKPERLPRSALRSPRSPPPGGATCSPSDWKASMESRVPTRSSTSTPASRFSGPRAKAIPRASTKARLRLSSTTTRRSCSAMGTISSSRRSRPAASL